MPIPFVSSALPPHNLPHPLPLPPPTYNSVDPTFPGVFITPETTPKVPRVALNLFDNKGAKGRSALCNLPHSILYSFFHGAMPHPIATRFVAGIAPNISQAWKGSRSNRNDAYCFPRSSYWTNRMFCCISPCTCSPERQQSLHFKMFPFFPPKIQPTKCEHRKLSRGCTFSPPHNCRNGHLDPRTGAHLAP